MARTILPRAPVGALAAATFVLIALLAPMAGTVGLAPRTFASYGALVGNITGPTSLATDGKGTYLVLATGGPAIAANGTQVGTISFSASIVGLNTTTGSVAPPQGVLLNGSANVTVVAPNVTQTITLYVDVTSALNGQNTSSNLTYTINILQPIVFGASLKVVGPSGVKSFDLTVLLDGNPVGSVTVPALQAAQSYPVSFSYIGTSLSPGWHTFSISLSQEHGLVVFANGQESLSVSFYVPGPPPDYAVWYALGAVTLGAVVFIWFTLVGARRRPKSKG